MDRRLSTIMAADVVGYSARIEACESEALSLLTRLSQLLEHHVESGGGRVFSKAGDGFLSEFSSPVAAVQAAYRLQNALRSPDPDEADSLRLRIGIHLADVVADGDNLLGDGVNIAARVESAAEPGAVFVTQQVFDQVKRTAQLTFEDLGDFDLKNISEPLRLFRIVGQQDHHSYISGDLQNLEAARRGTRIEPRSIVVLPFSNLSDDANQEYFSTGFSEDLNTELSRFREIFVVSRNASLALKGHDANIREFARDLGVAFCLSGSVRRMGDRVRISCQLIDTSSGDHVWAERFDCSMDELFDIQDELVSSIVSKVAGRIERQTQAFAKKKKPADMEAYDCLLRGLEYHRLGGVTQEAATEAVHWFSLAVEKDPNFGRAHAWRACALANFMEWTGQDNWEEIVGAGKRALELDDDNAECHRIMGSISLYVRDYDRARHHFERALELNPNHAYIVGRMGELYTFLGDGEKALELQRRAVELDPLLPAYCRELEAVAHYVLGEHEQTVAVVSQLYQPTRRAAAYAVAAATHLENKKALDDAVKALLDIDFEFTVNGFLATEFYKDRSLRRKLADDLKRAGLSASESNADATSTPSASLSDDLEKAHANAGKPTPA